MWKIVLAQVRRVQYLQSRIFKRIKAINSLVGLLFIYIDEAAVLIVTLYERII